MVRCLAGITSTASCKVYFKKFNILTFLFLLVHEISILTFKNIGSFLRHGDIHYKNERSTENVYIPYVRTIKSADALNSLGSKIFNKLPIEIKNINNFTLSKKKLKRYLPVKGLYDVEEFL